MSHCVHSLAFWIFGPDMNAIYVWRCRTKLESVNGDEACSC